MEKVSELLNLDLTNSQLTHSPSYYTDLDLIYTLLCYVPYNVTQYSFLPHITWTLTFYGCALVEISETRKLWKNLEPFIRSVMSRIYMQEISSSQWDSDLSSSSSSSITSSSFRARVPDLPMYSKYLLLASFLASSNPASTDRQFFSKVMTAHMYEWHYLLSRAATNACFHFIVYLGNVWFPFVCEANMYLWSVTLWDLDCCHY